MTWTEQELKRLYDKQRNEREGQTDKAREEEQRKEQAETEEREKVFRQMMEDIISTHPPSARLGPPLSQTPSPGQEKSFGGIFVAILAVVALAMIFDRSDKPSDSFMPIRIRETRSEPAHNGPDLEEGTKSETPSPERAHVGSPPAHTSKANHTHSDRPESISPETPPPSLQVIHRVTPAYPGLARQAHIGG